MHRWLSYIKGNTRNTLTQASKNGRKLYLFPQKTFVSVFYAINIFNTINYFKPTNFNCAWRKCLFQIPHFFRFCLPWFEKNNKIRCIDAPKNAFTHRNLPESKKYIWIIQNVHEKSRLFESRATRYLAVSAFMETSSFSSAASH